MVASLIDFGMFAVTALVMLIFAFVYKNQVMEKLDTLPNHLDIQARRRNLLECFKERDTCLHVTFCLPVVAAKNYQVAEVMGFWPGCILTFLLTHTPLYCIGAVVRGVLSWKVATRMDLERSALKSICVNLFCMPCDVGRESLQVDDELGATITCCCNAVVAPRIVTEASNAKSRLCPAP